MLKKKKKLTSFVALFLALSVAAFGFGGCSTSSTGSDSTATSDSSMNDLGLLTDGVLLIGTDDTMPPMEYRNESDELVGFDIDMGNEIGNRLGVEVQWVPTDWDGLLLGLSSQRYDAVISLICITEEREESMDFSDPYYVLEELIVARADDDSINSISDLSGKKIGCQTGSANYQSLLEMDGIDSDDIVQYNAVTDELQDVINGRLDCVVMEGPTAFYYTQSNDELKIISDDPIEGHDVGIAFNQGNDTLVSAINDVLAEMKEDGTLTELSIKWFGEDVYAE